LSKGRRRYREEEINCIKKQYAIESEEAGSLSTINLLEKIFFSFLLDLNDYSNPGAALGQGGRSLFLSRKLGYIRLLGLRTS